MSEKNELKAVWHITLDKEKDKWRVYREGAERATITFDTQKECIAYAKELAKKNNGTYYIHGENGRIRDGKGYKAKK
ncbi:DUF2188 domain-containing protein [Mycoplasmopsis felis]|uniref:DUF2188 domain-containing protein n=1 Tax=Mycoplasmopsis felis TaxID=33923 RepID=UPI000561C9D7|nr:DUF2188 domain-containing protein [Mycoplasmopsis felis]WQQ02607.1 DUF2188 domain-containing protein [Mycoplasmopsis felis]WQQ04072.1 DUF2188 domain-containing protein [Mycoplasmopsis felis]WQQ04581.1 DUF2188 domain-containing protein [Mycoplasmopsis felis]WQQ06772.1 DUF2188 domain-containing protein [Mycoplasmopsis felis]WQQ09791.1 DUF2188 domain-containing protein [Mycoplasmopsis felis]